MFFLVPHIVRRCRYHQWPFKLFHLPASVGQQEALYQEFLDTPGCCLDAWVSEPLRQKLLSVSDFMARDIQLLFQELRRHSVKATNMELENLLSEAKASVPFSKRAPLSERMVYLSYLSQLLKRHLKGGGLDSRGAEGRAALLQNGVPVRQPPQLSWRRDDTSWRNAMMAKWKDRNLRKGDECSPLGPPSRHAASCASK